ncbi:2OG-Fe(II) oxygenase [Nocardia anaemiae]|uniref:2OG-Fe(II) oxygenase n=1 Tax=Nocardia anaemiae TaxID=263910 RepID=UPI0007A41F9F|nr:2OG-Fe(II) oxygenase [Nocardia anaemiae]
MLINTGRQFNTATEPFEFHLVENALSQRDVNSLESTAPKDGFKRIEVHDPNHEKQYTMNLRYLFRDDNPYGTVDDLSPSWRQLLDELRSEEFINWLEEGTSLKLRDLSTDIGIYTHDDNDYISVHKDKPNKALTAILYLNSSWPSDGGGHYEVRVSPDPRIDPVRRIAPEGGRLLVFPPTDQSWHSVSPISTGGKITRLTVQLEFWLTNVDRRH